VVRPRAATSPDGQTLFFAGNERFRVVPVAPERRKLASVAAQRAQARRLLPRVQVWSTR